MNTPYPELGRRHTPEPQPACAGHWSLFDSTDTDDHRIARQFCAECPILNACRLELRAVQQATVGDGVSGGPRGTWAGRLLGTPVKTFPGLPQEVREARAAYVRGDRTDWAMAGNRAYERARREHRQQAS